MKNTERFFVFGCNIVLCNFEVIQKCHDLTAFTNYKDCQVKQGTTHGKQFFLSKLCYCTSHT